MRLKSDPQVYFQWPSSSDRKVVKDYREKYNAISELLDKNPEILDLVHRDLEKLSEATKREKTATYTAENSLRALIVHDMEGTSLRKTIVRIAESDTLRNFVRLGNRDVLDYSTLDKCFNAIEPGTWKAINDILTGYATKEKLIDPSKIRTDTTVVEANIHYPTDSSLLWDSYRKLADLLREIRDLDGSLVPHRFHEKKVKKLHLFIARYAASQSKPRKRDVKKSFRKLLGHVERILGIAKPFYSMPADALSLELLALCEDIRYFLPAVRQVVWVAQQIHIKGEAVPAKEKIYSIFEQHVELIKRGKRGKPVEFGHKIVLSETKEKFITDYQVMEKQISDSDLTEPVIEGHEELFGSPPDGVAADGGFWSGEEKMEELGKKVKTLAIPKNVKEWATKLLPAWQRFRAGIEGTISVLKRVFGLMRCPFRGFKNFASSVGLGIFCHNLVCLVGATKE